MTVDQDELAALLPAGQELLVSCFDAHHTTGGGLFSLGGGGLEIDRLSSSGLCVGGSELHRVLWSDAGSPAELLSYDERGVRRYHRLDGVSTPHDIMLDGDRIVVVATTQNSVLWIAPDGTVIRRWQPPGEEDSWHLNSVTHYQGRVVVCAFGRFDRRRGWDAAGRPATGCLVDVDSGETLLNGLKAPHNPVFLDGNWLVCNSGEGELLEIAEEGGTVRRRLALPGWPRGLVVSDRYLFVGLSSHRHAVTSVGSASVVAVDRASWQPVARVALPAREIYALAMVPTRLAAGVRSGFAANHTREHEQGQRRLFDLAGVRPKSLWATGDRLADVDCRVGINPSGPIPTEATAGELLALDCVVTNRGGAVLTGAPPYPVLATYRWYDAAGRPVGTESLRTRLPRSLPPGESLELGIRARVPATAGDYRLRVTLVQRGGREFDRVDPANAVDIAVTVTGSGSPLGPPAHPELGLTPGAFEAAVQLLAGQGRAITDPAFGPRPRSAVQTLLTHPNGRFNGMAFAFCVEYGVPALAERVADVLGLAAADVAEVIQDLLPAADEVMLTGAEAVALAVRRAGARRAFAYAGTSELALCDAFARLGRGVLINGRGDTESLFQAGGASRITPGTAVAVLHGARGLTNALGALADLRRNEVGTLVVVGLPSTTSAPFLPPHGETELIRSAGAFAKSWYELGPVPAGTAARAAAVTRFQQVVTEALELVRARPYGPVLIGVPQDVAEAAWVPFSALDVLPGTGRSARPGSSVPGRPDAGDLSRAGELIGAARRMAVLVDDYALSASGFEAALARFTERFGAAVLQVKYRRGPMLFQRINAVAVPAFLGWYEPSDAGHQMIMDGADLLLTIEDRNMSPRVIGALPTCRKIALTSHPAATAKNGYLGADDLLVHADPVAALDAMTGLVPAEADPVEPWYAPWSQPVPRAYQPPPAAAELRHGLVRAIGRRLADLPGPVLLDDSQMFGGLVAEEYDLLPPGLRVFGDHGAFVGGGIASAVGVALGEPGTRVLCCVGDQGFTNGLQGLVAARQEDADVTFIVCNNGGSVSLRRQAAASVVLLDAGRHHYLDNSDGLRYTDLAESTGVPAWRVDLGSTRPGAQREQMEIALGQFETVLGNALTTPGPSLIELVLPADQSFWTGVWITEGLEKPSVAALLFDLDGVLVDSHDSIEQAWRRWARRRGVSWEVLRERIPGRLAVDTIRAVLPDLPPEQVSVDAAEVNREQTVDTSTIVEVPGMRRLIEKAIADGLPWGVVTGCPRLLAQARLDAAGYPKPEVLVTAEDVAVGKPAPEGYLRAAQALGVPIGRCVVLEDSSSGVAAGRAAGATVIGVRTAPDDDLSAADLVVADAVGLDWPLTLVRTRA